MPRLIIYSIYTRFNTSVQRMERSVKRGRLGEFIEHSFVVKWRETRANKGMIIRVGSSICAARWMRCSSLFRRYLLYLRDIRMQGEILAWSMYSIILHVAIYYINILDETSRISLSLSLLLLFHRSRSSHSNETFLVPYFFYKSLIFLARWTATTVHPEIPPFREKGGRKPIIDHSLTDRVIGTRKFELPEWIESDDESESGHSVRNWDDDFPAGCTTILAPLSIHPFLRE